MSIEQLVCVSIGCIAQVATFVIGVLVGTRLWRKDSKDDTFNNRITTTRPSANPNWWHDPNNKVERR
jgi:hypothetical protein